LPKAIKSLINQTLSKNQYEIIVVDNASTDDTKKIIKEFSEIRYIYEPILGLSQARNTGWKNAKGKYIAYLDDDAIACQQWLEKIVEVFEKTKPMPGCVGGRINLIFKTPAPIWLSKNMFPHLGKLSWSKKSTFLRKEEYLGGGNIAFPKNILKEMKGFKINLGRKGNKLLSMEETFLREQIEERGYKSFYHPKILIKHHVLIHRLTKKWFLKRYYWHGASSAVIKMNKNPLSLCNRLKESAKMIFPILISLNLWKILFDLSNNPIKFHQKCRIISRVGYSFSMITHR